MPMLKSQALLFLLFPKVKSLALTTIEPPPQEYAVTDPTEDVDLIRRTARSLASQGKFAEAIEQWQRIEQICPDDEEAARIIPALTLEKIRSQAHARPTEPSTQPKQPESPPREAETPAPTPPPIPQSQPPAPAASKREVVLTDRQRLERAIVNHPEDEENYLKLADYYLAENQIFEAHRTLSKATTVSKDIRITEKLEEVNLIRAKEQVDAADRRAAQEDTEEAAAALEEARKEASQQELRVYRAQSQRNPNDKHLEYEIGLRLKRLGEYRDAIEPLKAGLELPEYRAAASFQIGEILQRFKQFPKALQCYRQSAQLAASNDGQIEWRKRALHRAGVLAFTMKVLDSAEQYFLALSELDSNYKDVRLHLDKLAEMREDF